MISPIASVIASIILSTRSSLPSAIQSQPITGTPEALTMKCLIFMIGILYYLFLYSQLLNDLWWYWKVC
jgi:hypothetical protein